MENQHRKITGYRELDQAEIDLMNAIKEHGAILDALVTSVRTTEAVDQRWVAIAVTHFQEGLMALTRSVARPDSF